MVTITWAVNAPAGICTPAAPLGVTTVPPLVPTA